MIEPTIQLTGYSISKTLDRLYDAGKMKGLNKDHYEYYQHLEQLEQAVDNKGGNDLVFNISVKLYNFVLDVLKEEE